MLMSFVGVDNMAEKQTFTDTINLSVQGKRDSYYFGGTMPFKGGYGLYTNSLPSIYNEGRQRALYWIHQHPQNSLWQGASARICQRVAGTSAEITGKRRVSYYQQLIMFDADRGAGIGSFVQKIISTWHWSDDGAVAEIIGRGDPSTPLKPEAVVGIGVLDPLKCYFTNDPEYPIWYADSVSGKLHRMHYTRVHRFVPYPFSDPELNGRGFSSLSRALSYVQQHIVQQQFIGESMHNEPPPGILLVNGMPAEDWRAVWDLYQEARRSQNITTYQPIMLIVGKPGQAVTVEFKPFAVPPPNYDPIEMTELQARAIALGLDTDPQDVLPLSGGAFGTNTQSKVLDRKNRDGGFTYLLKMLERFFNTKVLPPYLTFRWNYRDSEQSAEEAESAQRHLAIMNSFVDLVNKTGAVSPERVSDIVVRYLADTVENLAPLLTDDSGSIISLYDDDMEETDITAGTASDTGQPTGAPVPTSTPETEQVATEKGIGWKDFDAVASDFMGRFGAIMNEQNDGNIASRRRAGDLLRQQLRVYLRRSIVEGKKDGGVDEVNLTAGEESWFLGKLATESKYVSGLTERIKDGGLSQAQIQQSLNAWVRKTLEAGYSFGLRMAGEDGMYEFTGDDGLESCVTCNRLKGQRHRYSAWYKARLRPGVDTDNFICGGWNCKHVLRKTSGAARGRLTKRYTGIELEVIKGSDVQLFYSFGITPIEPTRQPVNQRHKAHLALLRGVKDANRNYQSRR